MRRLHSNQTRGFSLLELMTAVGIAGVLAGLSVVGFQAMMDDRTELNVGREIYAAMREARGLSRVTNQPVRLAVWNQEVDGVMLTRVRWEQVPCMDGDRYATRCPLAACEGARCCEDADEGCAVEMAAEVGETIDVSARLGLDLRSLDGLCFLGGSGAPRDEACQATEPPRLGATVLGKEGEIQVSYELNGLTGASRMHDCSRYPTAPGCTAVIPDDA